MNVLCCQPNIVWENKHANHAAVREMLERAAPSAGTLVILPEMFATGFSMNVSNISDSSSQETQRFLAQTATDYGVYMMGGLVTSGAQGRGRNECVVYAPDGAEVVRYSKLHPFTLAGEAQAYVAGSAVSLFKLREFTISPFICYDLRFPEDFREAAQQGADLFTVIANWPASRIAHWTALLKARAIENQAYVIGVNRCGDDPQFSYTGQSVIFDPHGNMLAQAGSDEITISAELDLSAVIEYREKFPFLKDMHHR